MFISVLHFFLNKIKNVYDNTGKHLWWWFFVNGNVFFSKHILNKAEIHTGTILLFKMSFGNNLIGFFITVMQKNRN